MYYIRVIMMYMYKILLVRYGVSRLCLAPPWHGVRLLWHDVRDGSGRARGTSYGNKHDHNGRN